MSVLSGGLVADLLLCGPRSSLCPRPCAPGRRSTPNRGSDHTKNTRSHRRYPLIHTEIVACLPLACVPIADDGKATDSHATLSTLSVNDHR
ncbi:hypothetical protein GCM10010381_64950 [Streptomyces xantholiticus]|nr:hypothetical protein GCM10010381_64950 [Streptomyces xantholiticus]